MTIRSHIDIRQANERLTNLERCAEIAPARMYEQAKDIAGIVGGVSNFLLSAVREAGLIAPNSDALREVEAVIYNYIREGNPTAYELISAEGFGEHVAGPAGERVLAGAIRDRDSLEAIRSGQTA